MHYPIKGTGFIESKCPKDIWKRTTSLTGRTCSCCRHGSTATPFVSYNDPGPDIVKNNQLEAGHANRPPMHPLHLLGLQQNRKQNGEQIYRAIHLVSFKSRFNVNDNVHRIDAVVTAAVRWDLFYMPLFFR
ncbi:hypothetical protein OUZ56_008300 [Daphnia magna]|uniref:Uncharacterized protein n=1 Tax=Daphnia magna TaxID=35525 RepID=A0ABR0ACJ7_9CRUS|nr:hypothetical protein OUZ56_008300 [Daphnia magna]